MGSIWQRQYAAIAGVYRYVVEGYTQRDADHVWVEMSDRSHHGFILCHESAYLIDLQSKYCRIYEDDV